MKFVRQYIDWEINSRGLTHRYIKYRVPRRFLANRRALESAKAIVAASGFASSSVFYAAREACELFDIKWPFSIGLSREVSSRG